MPSIIVRIYNSLHHPLARLAPELVVGNLLVKKQEVHYLFHSI